jgi:hypothetical protein
MYSARPGVRTEKDAWILALEILRSWVEATAPIGQDEHTRVMEGALAEAEAELRRAQREEKEARAAP